MMNGKFAAEDYRGAKDYMNDGDYARRLGAERLR